MTDYVKVPKADLEAIEKARKDLYLMAERRGWDDWTISELTNITQPMWKVANKKYKDLIK